MQNDRTRTLPAAALLTLFPGGPTALPTAPPHPFPVGSPAATTAAAPQPAETPYERRPGQYRNGNFVGAVRESRELPIPELRDAVESFLDRRPGGNTAADREFPAAAMLDDRARTLPAATLPFVGGASVLPPVALPVALAGRSLRATTAAAPQPAETPYERRLAQYRRGDFVGAVRESRERPVRELRDAAESFLDRRPGGNAARDREFLAAALLHLDLAGPAETAAEENEKIARRILGRVRGPDRDLWTRDAHVGLLGFYMEYGRLDDALRVARFLGEDFRTDPDARLVRGHLAALIGWMFHDERFFDQARDTYETAILARESAVGAEPPTDLRLRLAHLILRDGDAEGALAALDAAAAAALDARQRFLAFLLRGEALLWLDRAAAAEEAFAAAQAHHTGSISAATGLAAVRQRLGDSAGAGEAARTYLSAGGDADTWWDFLLRGLTAERPRLSTLRALVLQ